MSVPREIQEVKAWLADGTLYFTENSAKKALLRRDWHRHFVKIMADGGERDFMSAIDEVEYLITLLRRYEMV